MPLSDDEIRKYLEEQKVLYPNDNNLLQLLGNPMMMSLYVKVCKAKQSSVNVHTESELLTAYLDSLLSAHKEKNLGNDSEVICAEFVVHVLLPYIAEYMTARKKHALTAQETYQAVQKCYGEICQKGFIIAFPEYIGKIKSILGGAKNAEEWFDHTIYTLLRNKLALLWQDENKNYCLLHENFRDYLSGEYKKNNTKLVNVKRKRFVPYAIVAVLLVVMLSFGAIKLVSLYPSEYPKTTEEKNTVNMAMNSLAYSSAMLDLQLSTESKILKNINNEVISGNTEAFQNWKSYKEREFRTLDSYAFNQDEAELIIGYLTNPRNTIPLDVLKELYALPKEHREQLYDMLETFTEYISPDSVYSTEDKKEIVALYEEWLDNYATQTFIRLQQALEPLNEKYRYTVLYKVPYYSILNEKYVNINWGDKDYKGQLEAAQTKENDLSLEMKSLGILINVTEIANINEDITTNEKAEESTPEMIFAELKKIIGWHDICRGYYESALKASADYIDNPTENKLNEAKNTCTSVMQGISELEEIPSSKNEQNAHVITTLNMDFADFSANFNIQSFYKNDYTNSILDLLYYLNHAPTLNTELKHLLKEKQSIETAFRKIDYIGINHLLSEVSDEYLDDIKTNFLPGLKTFSADNLPWENTFLIENGFTPDEADARLNEMSVLSDESLYNQ